MNPAEREAAFRADLKALLKRHGAEMIVTDDGKPWGLHNAVVMIYMHDVADDHPYTEFQL